MAADVTTVTGGSENVAGHEDGRGEAALFASPLRLAAVQAAQGQTAIYVCDSGNSVVRKIEVVRSGGTEQTTVSTLLGSIGGGWAYQDGAAATARFKGLHGISLGMLEGDSEAGSQMMLVDFDESESATRIRAAASEVPDVFDSSVVIEAVESHDQGSDETVLVGADFFCDELEVGRAIWDLGTLKMTMRVCENTTVPGEFPLILGFKILNPSTAQLSPPIMIEVSGALPFKTEAVEKPTGKDAELEGIANGVNSRKPLPSLVALIRLLPPD
jgi:hypothetical protein